MYRVRAGAAAAAAGAALANGVPPLVNASRGICVAFSLQYLRGLATHTSGLDHLLFAVCHALQEIQVVVLAPALQRFLQFVTESGRAARTTRGTCTLARSHRIDQPAPTLLVLFLELLS